MYDRRRLRHHLHPDSSSSDSSCTDMADMRETAEEKLRNRVTVMLCQGMPPRLIEHEIRNDKTCTAVVKMQILAELHRLEVNA